VQIRPISPAEHRAAGELIVRAYTQVSHDIGAYAPVLADIGRRVADGARVLVAVDAGNLLGCVTYVPPDLDSELTEWDDPQACGIRMLAVEPVQQGRGIGRALVEACIREADRDTARRMILHTTDRMASAHRLYRRMGFVRAADLDVQVDERFWLRAYQLRFAR
jgi:predicted N-acetyltransferase YhbS